MLLTAQNKVYRTDFWVALYYFVNIVGPPTTSTHKPTLYSDCSPQDNLCYSGHTDGQLGVAPHKLHTPRTYRMDGLTDGHMDCTPQKRELQPIHL